MNIKKDKKYNGPVSFFGFIAGLAHINAHTHTHTNLIKINHFSLDQLYHIRLKGIKEIDEFTIDDANFTEENFELGWARWSLYSQIYVAIGRQLIIVSPGELTCPLTVT